MKTLLPLFSNNLLPIFLIAGAGYLLGKLIAIDPKSISRIVFYLFSPALVFNVITQNELQGEVVFRLALFAFLVMGVIAVLALLVGKALRLERHTIAALILVSTFANTGNFGLAVNDFAFGKETLAHATIFFVASGLSTYTLGTLIASMGRSDFKKSVANLLKLPLLYAVVIALIFKLLAWEVPAPLSRSINLLGQAAIPSMLVLLGLQLQRGVGTDHRLALGAANLLRLVVSPFIAIGFALVLGLQGPAWRAGILEASMPSAVLTIVLATEYDIEPALVTTAVTMTTLLSPLTLTPLLAFLGG